jgi:molybdopterin converting factor small subunit
MSSDGLAPLLRSGDLDAERLGRNVDDGYVVGAKSGEVSGVGHGSRRVSPGVCAPQKPARCESTGTLRSMATLRMFASAREAAGTGQAEFAGATVGDVLAAAVTSFGEGFARVLPSCRVWVNGEAADAADPVGAADEVAVLPPVSGGC